MEGDIAVLQTALLLYLFALVTELFSGKHHKTISVWADKKPNIKKFFSTIDVNIDDIMAAGLVYVCLCAQNSSK